MGLKTTLNFRIQNHSMLLVETEGSYTLKEYYHDLDIHVGQSYSVLVKALNHIHGAFYMVAASCFIPAHLIGTSIVRYAGFQGNQTHPIPPILSHDYKYSFEQALLIRYLDVSMDLL